MCRRSSLLSAWLAVLPFVAAPGAEAQSSPIAFLTDRPAVTDLSAVEELAPRYLVSTELELIARWPSSTAPLGAHLTISNPAVASLGASVSTVVREAGSVAEVAYVHAPLALTALGVVEVALEDSVGQVLATRSIEVVPCEAVRTTVLGASYDGNFETNHPLVTNGYPLRAWFELLYDGEPLPTRDLLSISYGGDEWPYILPELSVPSLTWGEVRTFHVFAGGTECGTFTVEGVTPDVTTHVEIAELDPANEAGDEGLWARAFDARGLRIYGATFTWSVDGRDAESGWMLADFVVDPSLPAVPVCARAGTASTCIDASVRFVSPRRDDGCNVARPSELVAYWPLALGWIVFARRLRRSRAEDRPLS